MGRGCLRRKLREPVSTMKKLWIRWVFLWLIFTILWSSCKPNMRLKIQTPLFPVWKPTQMPIYRPRLTDPALIPSVTSRVRLKNQKDTSFYPLVRRALELVHHERYREALAAFTKLIDRYPGHPMGYFYRAATYQILMRNYRTRRFENAFERALKLAIQKGNFLKKSHPDDADIYFFLGGAYGFRGLHRVRKGDWVGAFLDGRRGIQNLQRALEIDSLNMDVYYGLGTYHYWRTAKVKVLRLVPFFRDLREQGIHELRLAMRLGRFTRIEAEFALVAVYYHQKDYHRAARLVERLVERYPSNPAGLYMLARVQENLGNYAAAYTALSRLLHRLQSVSWTEEGYFAEVYFRLAENAARSGRFREAKDYLQQSREFIKRRNPDEELEGPLETFAEIQRAVSDLAAQLSVNEISRQ